MIKKHQTFNLDKEAEVQAKEFALNDHILLNLGLSSMFE